jgi:hypothetical protein
MNGALARFMRTVRSVLLVLVFPSIAGATAIACSGSLATSTASPQGGRSSDAETPPEDPDATPPTGATPPIDAGTQGDASNEGDATSEPTEAGPKDSGARVRSSVPLVHRASASACTQSRPPGTANSSCHFESCTADDQCEGGASGRCDCVFTSGGVDAGYNACTYNQCSTDSDCVQGGPCLCQNPTVCPGGNCATDSDCGSGGYCSPSHLLGAGAWSSSGFYCHTMGDECFNDSDCAPSVDGAAGYCAFASSMSSWVCSTASWGPDS